MAYIDIEGPRFDSRILIGDHSRVTPGDLLPLNCRVLFLEFFISDLADGSAMVTGNLPTVYGIDQHSSLRLEALNKGVLIAAAEPSYIPEGYRHIINSFREPWQVWRSGNNRRMLTACEEVGKSDEEIDYLGAKYQMIAGVVREYTRIAPTAYIPLRNCLIAERVHRFTNMWINVFGNLENREKPSIAISTGFFHLEIADELKCTPEVRARYLHSQTKVLNRLVQSANVTKVVFGAKKTSPNGQSNIQCIEVDLR